MGPENCIVGNYVSQRHFIERLARHRQGPTFAVHVHQSIGDGDAGGEPGLGEPAVELGAAREERERGAGVEEEGEGEVVGFNGEAGHAEVEAEGEMGVGWWGFGEAADGVVEEGEVWGGDGGEDGERGGEEGEGGVEGEEEGGEGVVAVEAGAEDGGVGLF